MKEDEKEYIYTTQDLLRLFRESGEANFQVFLDEYISWVYPEGDMLQ